MSVSAVHRVNYNLQMKVHLYHNKSSWNRVTDSTPRFFLHPVKLLHIERVAFTKNARNRGYLEDGYRNWRYKNPSKELTQTQTEKIYKDVQENYPYGHKPNDPATILKYDLDVKQNDAFQAFYSRYWRTNTDKINLTVQGDGWPYPYIEFTVNEVVTVKYPVGKIPSLGSELSPWAKYETDGTQYVDPDEYSCMAEDINMYVAPDDRYRYFIENSYPSYPLTINSSGQSYNFHLKSGEGWPTGSNGAINSGFGIAFSTGSNGTWDGHEDAEADGTSIVVKRFASPSDSVTVWYLTVGDKDNTHPYYGQGSSLGFLTSGLGDASAAQSSDLSLVRGNTYTFDQTDISNSGHGLYISTGGFDAGDPYTGIFSSGVIRPLESASGIGTVAFTVPYDAPDTLYYQCQNHGFMGGVLNLTDPVAASGNRPGETVRVTFNQGIDGTMFYYCVSGEGSNLGLSGMGGYILLKKECKGDPIVLAGEE